MVDRLGRFCHSETVVRQVWVEDSSLQGCEAAWWVFSDMSKEHSLSSLGTAKFFLDSLRLKMKAAQSQITATSHPMVLHHMTEDLDPLQYHCENLNSYIIISHYCT